MNTFQWRVILALCRIAIDLYDAKQRSNGPSLPFASPEDIHILKEALVRDENEGKNNDR